MPGTFEVPGTCGCYKMKNTKIKICGITNLADARFVAGAQVDYMGFIFYGGSPRYIEPAKAGAMINWIEGPQKVGVFVNQPLDDVNMIARQTGVDLVQLHGGESPEYCALVEKPVIKAIHVSKNSTPDSLEQQIKTYQPHIDYLLFDTGSDEKWGGTGQTFDWSLLNKINNEIPFFLSGGLNANNIQTACKSVQPDGIDLSSGIESKPGKKDFDKIEQFMHQFQKAETEN